MKTSVPASLLILVVVIGIIAQESANRDEKQFAIHIRELKGACYFKESEDAQPQRLKPTDVLRVGQYLSCDKGGRLKILFQSSGALKEIKKLRPDWYIIPNIAPRQGSTSNNFYRAGRAKGRDQNKNSNSQPAGGKTDKP